MPFTDAQLTAACREESPRWKFVAGTRYREMPRVFALQLLALAARAEPGRRIAGATLAEHLVSKLHPLLGGLPPDAEGHTREPEAQGGIGGWTHAAAAWSLVLTKETPEAWSRLPGAEKHRADLIMRALAVAGHFTMGDGNDCHVLLDGVSVHHKGWNINMTEGYVDVLAAAGRWLGGEPLDAFFAGFDFEPFVAELQAAGLHNIVRCWTHRPEIADLLMHGGRHRLPPPKTPLAMGGLEGVAQGVRRPFAFQGIRATEAWALHCLWGFRQFARAVRTRIIVQGDSHTHLLQRATAAEVSPWEGRNGMCTEFETTDWFGVRSSLTYAFEGVMINVGTAASLRVLGLWPDDAAGRELERRMAVGMADLMFKAREGYRGWAHGRENIAGAEDLVGHGAEFVGPMWSELFAPPEGWAKP